MKTIFNTNEAALFLSKEENFAISAEDVIDLTKQQRLPICFACDSELFPAFIENNGIRKEAQNPIPITGILRSLTQPDSNDELIASLVEIVRVDRQHLFRNGGERTSLPTATPHGGAIKPGFKVTGFLDFEEIPCQNWRFHIDDLLALKNEQDPEPNSSSQSKSKPEPFPQHKSEATREISLGVPKHHLTTPEIAAIDWPIPNDGPRDFPSVLSDAPKWMEEARVFRGAPGKSPSLWNPVMLAICLASNSKGKRWRSNKAALDKLFKNHLPEFEDEWKARSEIL